MHASKIITKIKKSYDQNNIISALTVNKTSFIILFHGINERDSLDVLKHAFALSERIRAKSTPRTLSAVYLRASSHKFFGNTHMYIYMKQPLKNPYGTIYSSKKFTVHSHQFNKSSRRKPIDICENNACIQCDVFLSRFLIAYYMPALSDKDTRG